ncbi:ArnT family glycosyltransferase [Neolewinella antarctica]|uniref:4-amino-4-deoxy-L-arabinose transferase-like glycosyltransferase n=1 Tax=Neolewinella antarctica TaxID=442734 RepID=A0ABX0XBE8_9BACT|nr:glycosyltransferase family 39 protein [Neolewinella antarctica]NJC26596.1 4-amino-4-deoxy-L-arabinose transferase-like glycosyltransferase [Neolewinella antarctica]
MKNPPKLYLLPLAPLLILFVGPILRNGIFIDGLAYTNLAKNMARGIGSIWNPLLEPNGPVFYGHPTLGFWLESLFFRVFGNHLWTEDIYNMVVLGLTLWCCYKIWLHLLGPAGNRLFWFPFLLFVLNQENQLRYPNAMLECSLTLIALGATYALLKFRDRPILATAVCGLGAFICFMIKGPVGLFPLGMPFLHHLIVERKFSLLRGVLPFVFCGAAFGMLFLIAPASYTFLERYVDVQVIAALEGKRTEHMAGTRFKIVFALLKSSAIPLVLSALVLLVKDRWRERPDALRESDGWFLIAVGLSAILPIMVSSKQASYYQVPSLPFLYLGMSLLLAPQLLGINKFLREKGRARIINGSLFVVVTAALLYALSFVGTTDRRDVEKIANAARVAKTLKGASFRLIVSGPYEHLQDSYVNGVPAYLNRNHDVFVDMETQSGYTLYIFEDGPRPPTMDGEVIMEFENHALVKSNR